SSISNGTVNCCDSMTCFSFPSPLATGSAHPFLCVSRMKTWSFIVICLPPATQCAHGRQSRPLPDPPQPDSAQYECPPVQTRLNQTRLNQTRLHTRFRRT